METLSLSSNAAVHSACTAVWSDSLSTVIRMCSSGFASITFSRRTRAASTNLGATSLLNIGTSHLPRYTLGPEHSVEIIIQHMVDGVFDRDDRAGFEAFRFQAALKRCHDVDIFLQEASEPVRIDLCAL